MLWLYTEEREVSSPGLLLYGQRGLIFTLATAAGWAAVCYGTHVADAARHKNEHTVRSAKTKGCEPSLPKSSGPMDPDMPVQAFGHGAAQSRTEIALRAAAT